MSSSETLPESWGVTNIGQVVKEIRTGGTPEKDEDSYWGGDIPWKASKHFNESSLSLDPADEFVTDAGRDDSTIAYENDVLLVCRGAHTGKVGIAAEDFLFNQDVKVMRPSDKIMSEYLAYYLMASRDYFNQKKRGGTTKGIITDHIKNLAIPVPPINKQQDIVDSINTEIERIRRISQSASTLGRLTHEYGESLMTFLFSGKTDMSEGSPNRIPTKDDIPENWSIETIDSISEEIRTGGTPKKSEEDYWEGDIPWKASKHFNESSLSLNPSTEYVTEEGKSESTIAYEDDVLLVCRGAHTGKVGIAAEEFLFNQDVKVIRLNDSVASKYVGYYLQSNFEYFKQKERGGTTKGITTDHVENLNIPLPPLSDQRKIIHRVENVNTSRVAQAVDTIDSLLTEYRNSVLAHEFKKDYINSMEKQEEQLKLSELK